VGGKQTIGVFCEFTPKASCEFTPAAVASPPTCLVGRELVARVNRDRLRLDEALVALLGLHGDLQHAAVLQKRSNSSALHPAAQGPSTNTES